MCKEIIWLCLAVLWCSVHLQEKLNALTLWMCMCTASCLPYCSTASKPHTVSQSMPFCTASCEHVGRNLLDNNSDYIMVSIPQPSWCHHPAKRSLPKCPNPTNGWIWVCVNPGWQIVSLPPCTVQSHPSCERCESQMTWTCAFPAAFHQQFFDIPKIPLFFQALSTNQHTLETALDFDAARMHCKFQKHICMPQITVNVQCMTLREGKK